MNARPPPSDFDAYFNFLLEMQRDAAVEARERAIETQREAGPLDDGQETDLPDDEAVTDYRNRRGE